MENIKCENCGANLEIDKEHRLRFCPYCGATVKIPETAFDHEKFVLEHQEKVREKQVQESEKIRRIGLIGMAILGFFLVLAYVLLTVFNVH